VIEQPPTRVALLHPRERAESFNSRFGALCDALASAGVRTESVAYHDDIAEAVEAQLCRVHIVLVWFNPIEGGRNRKVLDEMYEMLRRVAARGVVVSAHPETILRMGTKDVLVEVGDLPFGSESHRVESLQQLEAELPNRLAKGPRVLKQHRGHSGIGVWRIEQLDEKRFAMQHALRGSMAEEGTLQRVLKCLAPYFVDGGHMIDQAWQPRLQEGMVRAYLVRDRVAGFGHQAVNALYPSTAENPAPQPGSRVYDACLPSQAYRR
jgi:hypothetical protein